MKINSIANCAFESRRWLALTLLAALPATVSAAPTPIPGGANGVSAVSAKSGQTIFNGVLRIKIDALRGATVADGASGDASTGKKVMLMRVLLKNGANKRFIDRLRYTLADKDAVAFEIPSDKITNDSVDLIQGAALRQKALFEVDQDFVPTKLIIECASCGTPTAFRPVRITLTN